MLQKSIINNVMKNKFGRMGNNAGRNDLFTGQ